MTSHMKSTPAIALILFGFLAACGTENPINPIGSTSSQSTVCANTQPNFSSVDIVDANGHSVSSIAPNTTYFIRASGTAALFCITLTGGGTLANGSTSTCLDNHFPLNSPIGSIGTLPFQVVSNSTCSFTGTLVPYDSCGDNPQPSVSFTLPTGNACSSAGRHYTCGYALPGYNCDNGRNHAFVVAADMTSAIAACHAAQLSGYTDFCYVIDTDSGTSTDVSECMAASASWRPGNSCCNFKGTLSCPAICGDGFCNGTESASTCPADCAYCGDGICNGSETASTCPADCGSSCFIDPCPIQ